jgi:hypothetical protein
MLSDAIRIMSVPSLVFIDFSTLVLPPFVFNNLPMLHLHLMLEKKPAEAGNEGIVWLHPRDPFGLTHVPLYASELGQAIHCILGIRPAFWRVLSRNA